MASVREYARIARNEFNGGFQAATISGSGTIAANFDNADAALITMTGNVTLGVPTLTGVHVGDEIKYTLVQDATGSRTIGYNAIFRNAPALSAGAASTRASLTFMWDGVSWQFVGGSTAFA